MRVFCIVNSPIPYRGVVFHLLGNPRRNTPRYCDNYLEGRSCDTMLLVQAPSIPRMFRFVNGTYLYLAFLAHFDIVDRPHLTEAQLEPTVRRAPTAQRRCWKIPSLTTPTTHRAPRLASVMVNTASRGWKTAYVKCRSGKKARFFFNSQICWSMETSRQMDLFPHFA